MPSVRPVLRGRNDQRMLSLFPGRRPQLSGGLRRDQAARHQLGEEPLQVQAGREGLSSRACMSVGGSGHFRARRSYECADYTVIWHWAFPGDQGCLCAAALLVLQRTYHHVDVGVSRDVTLVLHCATRVEVAVWREDNQGTRCILNYVVCWFQQRV